MVGNTCKYLCLACTWLSRSTDDSKQLLTSVESQWFPTKPISTTESQQRPSVQSALRISFRTDTMSSRSLIFDVLVYSVHISSSSNLILKINSRPGDHWCIAGHLCSACCLCCTDFSFSQCMFQTHRTVPQVKQKWTYGDDDNADLHAFVSPLRDNNIFFYFF